MATRKLFYCILVIIVLKEAAGHGMMLIPPNRASLWRYIPTEASNYNDNEYFCGGREVQYQQNDGNCGVCGDNYADARPRDNENTGTYGNGIVYINYTAGSVIDTLITLTANHLGEFSYSLCILEDPSKPEPEDCFEDLPLADGLASYSVISTDYIVTNQVQLPAGVTCNRCVLRWHYKTGNSWGICDDGTQKMGCGDQESFRSCADIAIV